ncbi:hypothetical protein K3495_g8997 [Podosphaera aphanis]|nr:hypothetical protein K3495_g8997 [Podosphaera aphanis]
MINFYPSKFQSTTIKQKIDLLHLPNFLVQNENNAINYSLPDRQEAECRRRRPEHQSACFSAAYSSAYQIEMNSKRSLPVDEAIIPSAKQSKLEHPEEFSNTVKKRLATSTRTGQACDRCKVRKIRCDGLPGGCSPCLQNNTECFTTDRITGRATSRGYTEELEQQVRELQYRNQDLEQRLREINNPQCSNDVHNAENSGQTVQQPIWDANTYLYPPRQHEMASVRISQTTSGGRAVSTIHNRSNISYGNPSLISIRGTSLSLLGIEIDVTDFASDDLDEPPKTTSQTHLPNKSYLSFHQSILNANANARVERVELPPKIEASSYVEWYFKTLNPYQPLLHKPTVTRTLHQMYDDPSSLPSIPQVVIVHMIFSIMLYRYSMRNHDDPESAAQLNHRSNAHYHYCLSLFHQLYVSHTFDACQALTLICVHMKYFPKPGASWNMVDKTMSLALELGLHRSPKKWPTETSQSLLDMEMRKRVFWVLLGLHVSVSGKLGRPMRMRMEDLDCEIPEPIDDDSLEKGLMTSTSDCTHLIGIEAMKLVPLFLDLYNSIYPARRKYEGYISTICNLEARLRAWKEALPPRLTQEQEDQGFGLFAQMFLFEFRLLLRHPSVWMRDSDKTFNTESMRICVESSRQMLGVVRNIQKIKSLDATWCNVKIYVLAIITTLYGQWENKGDSTLADLAALKEEMDLWLDIMEDIGKLLGDGHRLREAIRTISENALELMNRSLVQKASFVPSKSRKNVEKHSPSQYHPAPINKSSAPSTNSIQRQAYDYSLVSHNEKNIPTAVTVEKSNCHQAKSYPALAQYSPCSENPSPSAIAYPPQQNPHNYSNYTNSSEPTETPLLAALTIQGSQGQQHNGSTDWPRSATHNYSPQIWTSWTNQVPENLDQPDCYGANALVQLGSQNLSSGRTISVGGSGIGEMSPPSKQSVALDQGNLGLGNINPHESGEVGSAGEWTLSHF